MEKEKCMLKLWWKIIYLAALGTLILNTYTMVHMDSSQRRLWKSKIRMIEKIEQEHPQDVGTVEVWDGEKKRVYYGLVTIGNDGSNFDDRHQCTGRRRKSGYSNDIPWSYSGTL